MRKIKVISFIILSLFLCNCITYTEQDFYNSTWVSSPSEVFVLNEDGTCNFHNLDWVKIYDDKMAIGKPQSFSSQWKLVTKEFGEQVIEISGGEIKSVFYFNIRSKNELYNYIGDPDQLDLYEFYRVEEESHGEDTLKRNTSYKFEIPD